MEKTHVICHIHALDHPAVLRILTALIKYNNKFTGEKIVTISKSTKELAVSELVTKILDKLNYKVFHVSNNELRETGHFFEVALPYLLSKTNEGILYYCHSKGISYHPDSEDGKVTALWTNVLLDNTLNNDIIFDKKYNTWGSCIVKKKDFLPDNIGEMFSFVGTFWWIRLSKLKDKEFKPTSKFYLEGLPGLLCSLFEAKNYGPEFKSGESPYKASVWASKGYNI